MARPAVLSGLDYVVLIDSGENDREAGHAGRMTLQKGAAIMELAILWLLCAAVFLELAERAPEID